MVTTRISTAEDLQNLSNAVEDFELIEGELVPMVPPNFGHANVQGNVLFALKHHSTQHSLGKVVGEAGFTFSRNPDTVLAPDVAFVSKDRIPEDTSGFVELAPELTVEIVSPSNSPGEIERKVAIYLQSGVRAVWVVYPEEREVVIHTPSGPPKVYGMQDQIDGGDVLPGLLLPVADIFA